VSVRPFSQADYGYLADADTPRSNYSKAPAALRRGWDFKFAPVTIAALLGALVLIFAFQSDNITGRFSHVVLIAIPITLQVYLNAGLAYGLMKWLRVEHSVAAPGALIGASNFFELAVATAIALFGPQSGAALATVVGVLVEVPVMLSVCAAFNRTRHWFPAEQVR
jgi:arsenite transporter